MRIVDQHEGYRLRSGLHTGYCHYIDGNGKHWVSQESGTRPATKREIKQVTTGLTK